MNIKDGVKALKNDLKSHRYYLQQYEKISETIDDMWYKLEGVSGLDPSKVTTENHNIEMTEEKRLEMLEKIEQMIKQKEHIEERIKYVKGILHEIESDMLGPTVDIYIKGKTFQATATKYDLYPSYLEYRIDKNLSDIIKKRGGN